MKMRFLILVLAMVVASCMHNKTSHSSYSHLSRGDLVQSVVNAINEDDWDALRELTAPGMQANNFVETLEKRSNLDQHVRVGALVEVQQGVETPDGKPCIRYSYQLENKDGSHNPHWLQVLVRDSNGYSKIVDFWEFGW